MSRKRTGFTLIELLISVAIIGIIVAISIANLLNAVQRARQKRTMGDMRSIGIALDSYAIDMNAYPPAAASPLPGGLPLPTLTLGNSASDALQPTYIQVIPLADGWSSWFTYGVATDQKDYVLRSAGADGANESAPAWGAITSFNADIILVDGQFLQFPSGISQ